MGGRRGHLQGDMLIVAARLGCERAMVGTRWANSHPCCIDRLRNTCKRFISGKEVCLGSERMFDNQEC